MPGVGERGGMKRQSTKDLGGGTENTLHDSVMMDTYHYTFIQTHRMYNTRENPNVNNLRLIGLWVIMMCQWRFISGNKWIIALLITGRLCVYGAGGVGGKSL